MGDSRMAPLSLLYLGVDSALFNRIFLWVCILLTVGHPGRVHLKIPQMAEMDAFFSQLPPSPTHFVHVIKSLPVPWSPGTMVPPKWEAVGYWYVDRMTGSSYSSALLEMLSRDNQILQESMANRSCPLQGSLPLVQASLARAQAENPAKGAQLRAAHRKFIAHFLSDSHPGHNAS